MTAFIATGVQIIKGTVIETKRRKELQEVVIRNCLTLVNLVLRAHSPI